MTLTWLSMCEGKRDPKTHGLFLQSALHIQIFHLSVPQTSEFERCRNWYLPLVLWLSVGFFGKIGRMSGFGRSTTVADRPKAVYRLEIMMTSAAE